MCTFPVREKRGWNFGNKRICSMKKSNSGRILIPIMALIICGLVVLLERYGVTYEYTEKEPAISQASKTPEVQTDKTCLILAVDDEISTQYKDMISFVLSDMKIGYDVCQVDDNFSTEILDEYDTAVITFQDWSAIGEALPELMSWIEDGGALMTTVTPNVNSYFEAVSTKLGILSIGSDYPKVYGFRLRDNAMIGAKEDEVFKYAENSEDALQTSLSVELSDKCQVWMESEDGSVPLIWTKEVGAGRVGIINESIVSKYQRGFLCMTYTLLHDAEIYPVINGSAFYLDDFPSPVPVGDGTYIARDYGVDIGTFYSSIWWPAVLGWENEYGICHTGVIIEQYSDEVEAPLDGNTEISQFETFGNMLLNNGGELGFHGYNHMPLCLEGVDEDRKYGDYKLWKSIDDMKSSVEELTNFCETLFPENQFCVYVPPSNIISETGIETLIEANPDIDVISSTYLVDADNVAYVQEFCVEDNGVISAPRITSGCVIDDYQRICALSELNYHYVQSHFLHPDDVLDEDRGAAEGWESLSQQFETYLKWINESVPNIRNLTGSEMGRAVEVFDTLSVQREYKDGELDVKLGGFSGEAQLMLRVNSGTIVSAEGCDYELVSGNMYLIKANSSEIKIYLGE